MEFARCSYKFIYRDKRNKIEMQTNMLHFLRAIINYKFSNQIRASRESHVIDRPKRARLRRAQNYQIRAM